MVDPAWSWTYDKVGYTWPGKHHSACPSGEVIRPRKTFMNIWRLPLSQMKTSEGNSSLCIEHRYDTGFFLTNKPRQYCNQMLWLHLKPFTEVTRASSTALDGKNFHQFSKCFVWFTGHSWMTWGGSATPLIYAPQFKIFTLVGQKSGLTWSGEKNKSSSSSSQDHTSGLWCQIFHNRCCSYWWIGHMEVWRCQHDQWQSLCDWTRELQAPLVSLPRNNADLFTEWQQATWSVPT